MGDVFPNRSAIAHRQLRELQRLFAALETNPFYREKFRAARLPWPFRPRSLGELSRVPFTTKQELVADQAAHPPFGRNLTYPLDRYTRYHQTSGTSDAPLRWLDTPQSWEWMVGNWITIFSAATVASADRVYFAFSFGPFIGFWLAFEAASRLGCLCIPGGGLSSHARIRAIADTSATVLCCTPTYAMRLAEAAAEEKIPPATLKVRCLILAGEPGASIPATRARLEALWPGARIFDHHGMTETGAVTFECPVRPGFLHVIESSYCPEIIDPDTEAILPPGARGELVLTNLGRAGSPLLRYRTGDLVCAANVPSAEQPCPCERFDLALEGGILGRTDDMITVRGVNVFPSAIEAILRPFPEIAEYQVQISKTKSRCEMEIQIEPDRNCADPSRLAKELERRLHASLTLRVPVKIVPRDSLPRFEMKAKRWLRRECG